MDALTAMKQALEAFEEEGYVAFGKHGKTVTSLRAAIEWMEKVEPVAWMFDQPKLNIYNWTTTLKAECERGENIRPLFATPYIKEVRRKAPAYVREPLSY